MNWLKRLFISESHFTAEDYRQKYPKMHPTDAEVLGKLNEIINQQRAKAYDWRDDEGNMRWFDEEEE
jgi:hypothetical protein